MNRSHTFAVFSVSIVAIIIIWRLLPGNTAAMGFATLVGLSLTAALPGLLKPKEKASIPPPPDTKPGDS